MFLPILQMQRFFLVKSCLMLEKNDNLLVLSLVNKMDKRVFYLFYFYIYPPDSQESDGGTNT